MFEEEKAAQSDEANRKWGSDHDLRAHKVAHKRAALSLEEGLNGSPPDQSRSKQTASWSSPSLNSRANSRLCLAQLDGAELFLSTLDPEQTVSFPVSL